MPFNTLDPNAPPTFAPTAGPFYAPATPPYGSNIFSMQTSDWPTHNEIFTDEDGDYIGTVTAGVSRGRYLVSLVSEQRLQYQYVIDNQRIKNEVINAPFYIEACPTGGSFGLVTHSNSNGANAYHFLLDCSGDWRFRRAVDGVPGDILVSGVVEPPEVGTTINMAILADDATFTLYIANHPVGQAEDTTYGIGEPGVYFEQTGAGELQIGLTNFNLSHVKSSADSSFFANYTATPGPSPTPTATPTPLPTRTPEPFIKIESFTNSVPRGTYALMTIRTTPGTKCVLYYTPPNGGQIRFDDITSDAQGICSWTWYIAPDAFPGTGTVIVTVYGEVARFNIEIER